jgi:CRISPR/Cas system-associated protein Cas10 (large subunit of type III CRISPR-Cas system)
MDGDSLDHPVCRMHPASKDKEHRRRNEEQAELLREAYQRRRHARHIDEALRRAGHEREADESHRSRGC